MKPRYDHPQGGIFLGQYREYDLWFSKKPLEVYARYDHEDTAQLAGLNFATAGLSYPLTKALSLAKARGLYKEPVETLLVPENDKEIFILYGMSGNRMWHVRAFRQRDTAEAYANACDKKAALWISNQSSQSESPPYGWSLLDPKMARLAKLDITYSIVSVPIAQRLEELSSHWEVCPICRGQVYETPDGRICENGHEEI